jgi:hypothetical protein
MTRHGRLLFFVAFVLVVGSAAWMQYTVQRAQADDTATASSATWWLSGAGGGGEEGGRGCAVRRVPAFLE